MVPMTHNDHKTIRVWPATARALRLVAALTGERMVQVLDRLIRAELARVQATAALPMRGADRPPDE